MKILGWVPRQPRITGRLLRQMDRLENEFKRQHGRRPRSAVIYIADDGRTVDDMEFEPEREAAT